MDFLARDTVSLPEGFWAELDQTVVSTAKKYLTARRFLPIYGPLGAGADSVQLDRLDAGEEDGGGVVKTAGRRFVELPQLYEDFTIGWRDIESAGKTGYPIDYARAAAAAQKLACREDTLIFFGSEFLGTDGLLTAPGTATLKKGDWAKGENAFLDVAKGLALLRSKGILGRYSLILSAGLYADLYRVQPGLGIVELDRISAMLGGNVFSSSVLGSDKALLVCGEAQYMDLAVGKDLETAYLETRDLNYVFRVLETAALRLKCADAVVKFE